MKLRQIFEAPRKVAVTAFGRMNPPTIGHEKLVDKITAIDGDHYLFLSQTQKPKDNPLPFDVKLEFSKKFFPGVNVGHPTVRTAIQMLQMLEKLGYTDIVYVAGSDRVEQFEKLFNDYNGKDYTFDSIQVVSAGERDPDADGAEGMSASKMRAAAASGDFDSFAQGVPTPALAQKLYDAVRSAMGIKDTVNNEADRGFSGVGGARGRENDENDKIDAQIRAQNTQKAQYLQSGKFWLKTKDTQQHISDEYVGKAAANAAAVALLKQQPELKGNLLITAYGPNEKQEGVAEGLTTEKQILTRIRQIMYDRKLSGTDSNAGELLRLRQQLKDLRSQQGVAEATGDKPFDSMMKTIKKGTAKQKTADRRAEKADSQQQARAAFGPNPAAGLGIMKKPDVPEAAYEGNIGIMELFKFFAKAGKQDPDLVAKVKDMIKQRRDKEVWRIIQDYTGTQLTGKEFEGSIKETIFRKAGHSKHWCEADKKWQYRQGPTQSRSS